MAEKKQRGYPVYSAEREKCKEFLQNYEEPIHGQDDGDKKYVRMLNEVADRKRIVFPIDLNDIILHNGDSDFIDQIEMNTRRYRELFSEAIDELLPPPSADAIDSNDIYDVLQSHRMQNLQERADDESAAANAIAEFPKDLLRRYQVQLLPRKDMAIRAIRDVRAIDVGHLVRVKGIVVRTSDVRPLVTVATYTCDNCGFELYQEVVGKTFTPLSTCTSPQCEGARKLSRVHLQTRGCKFVKYQEIRMQELPNQVPAGHIPRSITIVARGELTRQLSAGDIATITGVFTPVPFQGYRAIRAGLIADTYLEMESFELMKQKYEDMELSEDITAHIDDMSDDKDIYSKLARSICPEIYGHEDVKKALLLQLVGGVTRHGSDGMRIRGDINVLLMGDPGVAKSQLLKHIATIAPRGVYTTGKGSSGVGLTAAVMRDPMTNELTLEGGALVLADMGICAIDEFDKMDDSDRTAIYEVMEQQTVSIAKAGITTTLNARTSILAAANPLYGRFRTLDRDAQANVLKNINLPAALMSRFDLMFLLLDKPSADFDMALARHVTHVHQHSAPPQLEFEAIKPEVFRAYIASSRGVDPYVPQRLSSYIVEAYVSLRREDADAASSGRSMLTPRQLLSILRLAQAHARLRFATEVAEVDIDEALRLVECSKASITSRTKDSAPEDEVSRIYGIIRKMAVDRNLHTNISMTDIENTVTRRGFSAEQLRKCIDTYDDLNVWRINASRTLLSFV